MRGLLLNAVAAHTRRISHLAFLPNGDLISGSVDGSLAAWDKFGCVGRAHSHRRGITGSLAVAGRERVVTISFDGTAQLHTGRGLAGSKVLQRRRRGFSRVARGPGRLLLCASFDGTVTAFQPAGVAVSERVTWRGPAFVAAAGGGSVYTWSVHGPVQLRAAASLEHIEDLPTGAYMTHDVWAGSNGYVYTYNYDHMLRTWLAAPWVLVAETYVPVQGRLQILRVGGGKVWLGGERCYVLVDTRSGYVELQEQVDGLSALAIHPTEPIIACGLRDGTLQLWRWADSAITKN